ncbi:MAG: MFS transporter [Alphaproteobacteria bacterium]|nr:MFS transporter [Alphaproteobacteria bacterium]
MNDGLPLPQRIWAVVTIGLALTMAVMDSAIANVALPTIAREFHAAPSTSIWIVNGYQLAITISLLPLAAAGDIIGYCRVYLVGLILFTLASLACALSGSLAALALARVLQGFGAAGVMSVNAALVRFIYPQRLLGRGIGINAVVIAISAAVGPTIASGILSVADWPWLFAVNVPIGIAAYLIGRKALPVTPRATHAFDVLSAMLSALSFGLLIATIDAIGHGETAALIVMEVAALSVSATWLVRRQAGVQAPLLPTDLLRIPLFSLSISASVCSFAAQMLALVSLPFFLQGTLHFTAVETGLLITPWPLAIAVVAPLSGKLADRYSAGLLGALGLLIFAAGLFALALVPAHAAVEDIVWRMALAGIGFGLFQSPNNRAILTSAPRERSGGASGMLGTARLLGQTTGAALVALVFARTGEHGETITLYIAGGIALVAAVVSSLRLMDRTGSQRPLADSEAVLAD